MENWYNYTISDGNGGTSTATATVTITGVNDAPVLDVNLFPTLTAINENQSNNAGTLVASMIGSGITDVDNGAVQGIAVTALDTSHGTWQYSTDNGSSWNTFGSVSDASATVLSATANDRIRFVPNANYDGTANIDFRAWDTTDGNVSGTSGVNVSTNGGTTAYSSATETSSITVNPNPQITLTFEGVGNFGSVQNFYSSQGITFSSNALGLVDSDAGGSGNFGGEPSASTTMFFLSGSSAIMNVLDGFENQLSFFYSSPSYTQNVTIFDGLNSSGNVLASVTLGTTPVNGAPDPTGGYSPLISSTISFSGEAKSVSFGSVAGYVVYDDITLG